MTHKNLGIALLASLLASGPVLGAHARPAQTPVFGASVTLTRLRAAVVDDAGRAVQGLGADDFRVLQDGIEQQVQVVLAPEVAPLELALVLDFSGSIAEDWPQVRGEVVDFLDALAADDCLYLVPFNSAVGPGVWARPGDRAVRRVVESYPLEGRTRLYDAIQDALEALGGTSTERSAACATTTDRERRRALVMLSDGMDEGSGATYSDTLLGAWRSGVPAFPVAVGAAAIGADDLRGLRDHLYADDVVDAIRNFQGQLREIARVSGGSFVNQRELGEAYEELLSLLRSYYVIGYRSEDQAVGGWREVEVELRSGRTVAAGARVLAQPGFYARSPDAAAARDALAAATEAFDARRMAEAARWFGIAAGVSAEVGRPFFGRGLSLEAVGRLRDARAEYQRSLLQNPGVAATHLRLARVSLGLSDLVSAREHAIRAALGGADAASLWRLMGQRGVAGPTRAELGRPVVFILSPEVPALGQQLLLRRAQRAVAAAIDSRDGLAMTRWYPSATAYLITRLRRHDEGPPERLTLRAELYDLDRNRLWDGDVTLADMGDEEATRAASAALVDALLARLER